MPYRSLLYEYKSIYILAAQRYTSKTYIVLENIFIILYIYLKLG